jgi:hypothetical protein
MAADDAWTEDKPKTKEASRDTGSSSRRRGTSRKGSDGSGGVTPGSAGTRVEMTYTAGGYAKGGLEPVAKIVDQVLATQVQRLKRFIEVGKPQ